MEPREREGKLGKYKVVLIITLTLLILNLVFFFIVLSGFYNETKDKEDGDEFSSEANFYGFTCLGAFLFIPVLSFTLLLTLISYFGKKRSIRREIAREDRERRRLEEKRRRELEMATNFEISMRFEDAVKLYEGNDRWNDARRCRELMRAQKLEELEASRARVDIRSLGNLGSSNITNIKDSVINRSNIGEKR